MSFARIWHKWYPQGVPAQVDIQRVTMPAALLRTADRYPERTAFIYMGKRISYGELTRLVNRFARALTALGVGKGDKVGMLLPNIPQIVIADLAVYMIGAVTVMNNPLYTERELAHQLNDSETTTLVTLDLLLLRVLKIKHETRVRTIITCHINDYLPFPKKQLFIYVKKEMYRKDEPRDGVFPFMHLIGRYPDSPVENQAQWDETAGLLYTGGTTGVSKGVELTHSNVSALVQQFSAWFPDLAKGQAQRLLGIYPIFHSAGYLVSQNLIVWNGWTSILVPRPDPTVITEMLKKFKPDFLPGVPTIYVGLLHHEPFRKMDLSFIKGYFGGAAPLPEDTLNQLKSLHGAIIHDVYGSTETGALATCTPWQGHLKLGTVGIPLPNTDLKLVDPATGERISEPNRDGEICVRGPQIMKGYYNKKEETDAVLVDGWIHMGDIGRMDEDGYLTIVDRKKDMIIAGGYNVYPKEVDEILMAHPKVMEACTIGIPDEYRGETVKAYVVPMPGATPDEGDILNHCRGLLAAYKVPRQILFIDQLPKTAVGKIKRKAVRDLYLAGMEKQKEPLLVQTPL
ncbi:MAG: long-chain fatty acid--CoA ligase [Desulfobacteraceae bacterium]|nr:MAG: long-chain fatty acid--CoA ligase [Desulfobacteraceae bacterium]